MTTKPQSTTEAPMPPDRISINPTTAARYPIEDRRIGDIEYARVSRQYFCSCGAALTAEEYITHYFELGHDRGDPAFTAPVVDNNDLISRAGAKAAMCNMCANPDRYKPAEPLEGSMRLFHFQRSDNWNAGQCLAQAIDSVPAAAPVEQSEPSPQSPNVDLKDFRSECCAAPIVWAYDGPICTQCNKWTTTSNQ